MPLSESVGLWLGMPLYNVMAAKAEIRPACSGTLLFGPVPACTHTR